MYEHRSSRLIPVRLFVRRLVRHFYVVGGLILISLVGGMAGYVLLADMNWVDAFLNASMLLGGMGPVGDLPNNSSKIFAGVFALYSGLVFIASAGILVAPIAHRVLHKLHVEETGRKQGERKD
jgi:hypothetical protein